MNAQPLWDFINERHHIYLRRQANPDLGPWSDDPIFQRYRFCNVFRELDTVTIWIRQHIRQPLADHPLLWFWLALARNVNWPDALQSLQDFPQQTGWPDEYDMQGVMDVLSWRRQGGLKTFGSAYVITNGGTTMPKEEYVCRRLLQPLWEARDVVGGYMEEEQVAGRKASLQRTWNRFREYEGFGPFIAYEVVTDLRHTRYLSRAEDIYSWANAGPGAKRGLRRLAGLPAEGPMAAKEALDGMRRLLWQANNEATTPLGKHVPLLLEMRDIEHSLCETDKYLRALTGEGKPKQQFRPGAVYGDT